ncbi:YeeE/YedE family protein [Methylobacillus caricis]|uniref:YeeE/YedE family protein n=1 Tax=Methylobacillus caricis TaxID=1971611 RepID=UPI001CFFEDD1|nr:YeeE/YedE family protein [Methylobacillus caricis]MCB5187107.1 YeeE/YedE family protein [Methylobacillus caricis]
MHFITALLAGLLFGLGLIVSGMTNPQKVLAFLDITDQWDPSLAFVMLGAIPVMALAYRLMGTRRHTCLQQEIHIPSNRQLDAKLVAGAVIFGIGWGLVGYCPGPALASLLTGHGSPVVFSLAMVAGMLLYRLLSRFMD